MSEPACFQNIIGLSRGACGCTDEGKPTDADVSASGIYLDETPGLNLSAVQSVTDNCGELWDMMERARENAIRDYKADTMACIRSNTRDTRKANTSVIGEYHEAKKVVDPKKPIVGMMVKTAEMVGGTITLKRIGIKVDTTGDIDVKVYDRENLLNTYTVPAVAGVLTWYVLPYPLELTMDSGGSENPKYYLLWEPTTQKPYNTRLHCGCVGKGWMPYYNDEHPYWFESASRKEGYRWTEWVMATGVKGDDVTLRDDFGHTNDLHGLVAEFSFACDRNTTLCDVNSDYSDPVQMEGARAVQMRAAYYLASLIKSSGNPSFWTLVGSDDLQDRINVYQSEYRQYVQYVCTEMSKPENINLYGDCLRCKDEWGFKVSTILS